MESHDYFYEYEYEYPDYDKFYRRRSDPSEVSSDSGVGPPTPDRVKKKAFRFAKTKIILAWKLRGWIDWRVDARKGKLKIQIRNHLLI